MGTQMSKAFGGDVTLVDDTFYEEVGKGSGGFLRMGENFRIGSFNTKTPSGHRFELRASSFELRAEPIEMPDLGSMFGGGASQSDS
jgi:hypothetical protein